MLARALKWLLLAAAPLLAAEEFNPRVGVLEEFAREVGRGEELVLRGELKGAYRSPELIIIAPNGKTYLNRKNDVREHRFVFTVEFEHGPGPYRMEIIGRKPDQIRWFARFTVWHGRRRPATTQAEEPPPEYPATPPELHERLIERRVFGLLNRFRAEVGVPQVRWNEAVAARAREHAARLAKVERVLNRIGGVGVREMLAKEGAGGGLSGPNLPWPGMSGMRPFPRPVPQARHDKLRNYVLAFPIFDNSYERMFHDTFVTEAAYRIAALDPFCIEAAVGVAHPRSKKRGRASPDAYFVVCFAQINDKQLIAAQDRAYAELLREASARDPELLRWVGIWGRAGRGTSVLDAARRDPRPAVAAAAFDGLLLLDEERANRELARLGRQADRALAGRRYGAAVRAVGPCAHVTYDRRIREAADRLRRDAEEAARRELDEARQLAEPGRARALRDLRERVEGLPIADEIGK